MKTHFYRQSLLAALIMVCTIHFNVYSDSNKIAWYLNSDAGSPGYGPTNNNEESPAVSFMRYNFYCCDLCASVLCKTDIICYGGTNGQATATATGGTKPYRDRKSVV